MKKARVCSKCGATVVGSRCAPCRKKYLAEWYAAHREEQCAYSAEYRRAHPEAVLQSQRAYYARNPHKLVDKKKRFIAAHPGRVQGWNAEYARANRGKLNAKKAAREASRVRATPAWANKKAIERVYKEAVARRMDVDHIVPLNGRIVCGLHVEHNLQLLSGELNRSKGHRYWPDMP